MIEILTNVNHTSTWDNIYKKNNFLQPNILGIVWGINSNCIQIIYKSKNYERKLKLNHTTFIKSKKRRYPILY